MASRPTWPHGLGLIIGGVAATWWLTVLVASLFVDDPGATADGRAEGIGVAVLAAANITAYLVATRHPRKGGLLLFATGFAFCVFAIITAGRNQLLAAAVSGGPFVVSGALMASVRRRDGG